MIGKATIFAIAMLVPGLAFAAGAATPGAVQAVGAHDTTGADTTAKSDVKAKPDSNVKTAKAKGHKSKAVPATEKKTETKS